MKKIGSFIKSNENASLSYMSKSNSEYRISKIQIKNGYGYEQGLAKPRSEFAINACVVYNDGPANFVYLFLPGRNSKDWSQTIRKVTKSEVSSSTIIDVNNFFSPNYSSNNNFVAVYWNTFERDWNRSAIDLGNNGIADPYVWVLWGNARYSGDWYQWIPSTTRIHAMPYEWFSWESSVKFESWKSSITIKPN